MSGCPADVALFYLIDDVVAFHEAGAGFGPIETLVPRVGDILSQVPQDSDAPGPEARRLLFEALSEERPGGLRVLATGVDLGGCGPQPPRIETRREQLPALETVGVVGRERIPLPTFEIYFTDGERIEVDGAVATYDVIEEGLLSGACHASAASAQNAITRDVIHYVRRLMRSESSDSFPDITDRLPEAIDDGSAHYRTECGIELGAVDFGATVLTRLTPINCNEAPGAPECTLGEAGQP